jgi:hypothetical protein
MEDGEEMRVTWYLFILGLFLMASCRDASSVATGENQVSMQSNKLNRIVSETGLAFPADAKVVHFVELERLVDPVWVAKVTIAASSYEKFRKSLLGKTIDNTVYHGALADSTSWWKPANVLLTKQFLVDRQTFVNVVVSKEGEEFAVYVECAIF